MSVLRGVAIRIPLLVYGAEINDEAGEEITIDNLPAKKSLTRLHGKSLCLRALPRKRSTF